MATKYTPASAEDLASEYLLILSNNYRHDKEKGQYDPEIHCWVKTVPDPQPADNESKTSPTAN